MHPPRTPQSSAVTRILTSRRLDWSWSVTKLNSKSQKHILQIVCRKSNTRNFDLIYIFTGANLKLNCRVNAKTNERCMPRTPSFPFLTESPFPLRLQSGGHAQDQLLLQRCVSINTASVAVFLMFNILFSS